MSATATTPSLWWARATWLVGLGNNLALAGQAAAFWIVGSLVGHAGMDVARASDIAAIELVAMGLTMTAVSPIVHRLPRRTTMLIAIGVIFAAQIGSITTAGFVPLLAVRALAGVGFGGVFALSSAIGAATPQPERTFALASAIGLLVGTVFNPILGLGSDHGPAGVFTALTAISLGLTVPIVFLLGVGKAAAPGVAMRMHDAPPVQKLRAIGIMFVMALMAGANNGVFAFIGKVAGDLGLAGPSFGAGLALVSLLSALGGLFANWFGTRRGVALPLMTGLVLLGVALWWLADPGSKVGFWIAITAVVSLYWFNFAYILGLASAVDRYGRIASATGTAKIFAAGIGVAVGGQIAAHFGYPLIGTTALTCMVLAAVLVLPLVREPRSAADSVLAEAALRERLGA